MVCIIMHRYVHLGRKARTTLTIDKETLKTAQEIGINVSQFCENALKEDIRKLQASDSLAKYENTDFSLSSGSLFGYKRK